MAKMNLQAIKATLETIQGRYNGDNDTIPGAPVVLWADSQLAHALAGILDHVEALEGRMESHAHPVPHPKDPRPSPVFPPPVYVFCSGGVVNDVTDEWGAPYGEACIIDYDLLESGECPVCHTPSAGALIEGPCPRCTFKLSKYSPIGEALRAAHVLENQKGE